MGHRTMCSLPRLLAISNARRAPAYLHPRRTILTRYAVIQSRRLSTDRPATDKEEKPQVQSEAESASKPSKGLFQILKQELYYAQEYLSKSDNARSKKKKRTASDLPILREKWKSRVVVDKPKPNLMKELEGEEAPDLEKMSPEEREEYEKVTKAQETINATPLAPVGKVTVWDQRLESMRETARRLTRRVTNAAPGGKVLSNAKQDFQDQVEDLREIYQTSQHPVLWKLRELEEAVTGETEMAFAVGELRKRDPSFDMEVFMEELEHYMIPAVLMALMEGNMAFLRSVCEEQAVKTCFAVSKEREARGQIWDNRLLEIKHLEVVKGTVHNEVPYLVVSFVGQHIHWVRNKKGETVEGHHANLQNVFYRWIVRQDPENPDFDWKLMDLSFHRVHSII